MDIMREKYVAEINRLQAARAKSKSKYLRKDYAKAISRMKKELAVYDMYKRSRKCETLGTL